MVSPGASASGFAPVSTLIPGTMPRLASTWTSGIPPELFCLIVSSCMITPLMRSQASGAVKSISRYARRLCSVDRIPEHVEPLAQRARGLVGGQDALAVGDQRP
jgi:hypothetical protein